MTRDSDLASALGVAAVVVAFGIAVALPVWLGQGCHGIQPPTGCKHACGKAGMAEWAAATKEAPEQCRCRNPAQEEK